MEILVETQETSSKKSFPRSWKLWKVAKAVGLKITDDIYFESDDFKGGRNLAGLTLEDLYQVFPFWLKIHEKRPTQAASGASLGQTTPPASPTDNPLGNPPSDGEISPTETQVIEEIQSTSDIVFTPLNPDSPSCTLSGVSFAGVDASPLANPVIEEIQSAPGVVLTPLNLDSPSCTSPGVLSAKVVIQLSPIRWLKRFNQPLVLFSRL
jgi:hypothetical protein